MNPPSLAQPGPALLPHLQPKTPPKLNRLRTKRLPFCLSYSGELLHSSIFFFCHYGRSTGLPKQASRAISLITNFSLVQRHLVSYAPLHLHAILPSPLPFPYHHSSLITSSRPPFPVSVALSPRLQQVCRQQPPGFSRFA